MKKAHFVISFIPMMGYLLFWYLIIKAAIPLGHLPTCENPGNIALGIEYTIFSYFFLIALFSSVVWGVLYLRLIYIKDYKLNKRTLLTALLGISLLFITILFDPYGLLEWIYD